VGFSKIRLATEEKKNQTRNQGLISNRKYATKEQKNQTRKSGINFESEIHQSHISIVHVIIHAATILKICNRSHRSGILLIDLENILYPRNSKR